jgi:hypothetical protein
MTLRKRIVTDLWIDAKLAAEGLAKQISKSGYQSLE